MIHVLDVEILTSEEARTSFRRLLNIAQRGQCAAITRYDEPMAMIVPFDTAMEWLSHVAAGAPNGPEARLLAEARAVLAAREAETGSAT